MEKKISQEEAKLTLAMALIKSLYNKGEIPKHVYYNIKKDTQRQMLDINKKE